MAAKIRQVRVTRGGADAARDLRVDFLKTRAMSLFRNQVSRGQKTKGS